MYVRSVYSHYPIVVSLQAARVATRTHDSLDQMRNDWQKVDLKGVLCQTSWVMDELQFADELKDIIIQCKCVCIGWYLTYDM